jgi:peptidyl-prolyl cis-trans isomerase B (cyclophilin B)
MVFESLDASADDPSGVSGAGGRGSGRARGLALRLVGLTVTVLLVGGAAVWAIGRTGRTSTPAAHTARLSPSSVVSPSLASCEWIPYHDSNAALKDVGTPPTAVPATGTAVMTITTNLGVIRIAMDPRTTPCTVANFVYLAGEHFFDHISCHRLLDVPNIGLLQCGDPTGTDTGGPTYQFPDEIRAPGPSMLLSGPLSSYRIVSPDAGLPSGDDYVELPSLAPPPEMTYPRGIVAMANQGPDTNGSQFFMVYRTGPLLAGSEQFGTIIEGLDILTKVAGGGDDGAYGDHGGGHPKTPLTFQTVTVQLG